MDQAREKPSHPYGSAADLPSFQEMQRFIQGAKWITRVIARDQRKKVMDIEREMSRLVEVVDRFYQCLGPRNWVFPGALNLDALETLLGEADSPEDAEERLINIYRSPEASQYWAMRLCRTDGLRERRHQIERALDHYRGEQFDSCALHLIAVMDGFVNDHQPETRKGLAARDPDEMVAWDSVVGHHLGLTHVLKTFRKTIKKRIDEEVFEVYRHGIVHGMVVRFDNAVVATKAWNMLFAVADWASATMKAAELITPDPTWRDLMRQIQVNAKTKAALAAWQRSSYESGDKGFEELQIFELTTEFLVAWRTCNFGTMARICSRLFVQGNTETRAAGELRSLFEGFDLTDFHIQEIENSAPAVWIARGTAWVNDSPGTFECRWIAEDEAGNPGYGSDSQGWRLVCSPSIWTRSR